MDVGQFLCQKCKRKQLTKLREALVHSNVLNVFKEMSNESSCKQPRCPVKQVRTSVFKIVGTCLESIHWAGKQSKMHHLVFRCSKSLCLSKTDVHRGYHMQRGCHGPGTTKAAPSFFPPLLLPFTRWKSKPTQLQMHSKAHTPLRSAGAPTCCHKDGSQTKQREAARSFTCE